MQGVTMMEIILCLHSLAALTVPNLEEHCQFRQYFAFQVDAVVGRPCSVSKTPRHKQ